MCADAAFEPVNWLIVDGDPLPLTPESEIIFYPSCGTSLLWTLADLPGDIVVLSDYLPVRYPDLSSRKAFMDSIYASFERNGIPYEIERTHRDLVRLRIRGKVFLLFFEDNNDTLSRIVASGARISTFVSICDGCSEGGNYECVNDTSFLSRVLTVASADFRLFTDHSRLLEDPNRGHFRGEFPRHAYFRERVTIKGAVPGHFVRRGLLIAPALQRLEEPWNARLSEDDLTIFPSGTVSAGLEALKSFRTRAGRGILVEYGFEPFRADQDGIYRCSCVVSDYLRKDLSYPPAVVLNVPHAGTDIPPRWRQSFLLGDDTLTHEINVMTDHYTGVLFSAMGAPGQAVIASVSRLLVDTERFPDDKDEPMSAVGMGALYSRTSHQQPLRHELSRSERTTLLNRYHVTHHTRLAQLVAYRLDRFGHALVLDCHSFPDVALPHEAPSEAPRPDICIGTDEFHTPAPLRDAMVAAFTRAGFTVTVNTPYAGALVPLPYYGTDNRVSSIMVEVNRRLYMGPHRLGIDTWQRSLAESPLPTLTMEMSMVISAICQQVLSDFIGTLPTS